MMASISVKKAIIKYNYTCICKNKDVCILNNEVTGEVTTCLMELNSC